MKRALALMSLGLALAVLATYLHPEHPRRGWRYE